MGPGVPGGGLLAKGCSADAGKRQEPVLQRGGGWSGRTRQGMRSEHPHGHPAPGASSLLQREPASFRGPDPDSSVLRPPSPPPTASYPTLGSTETPPPAPCSPPHQHSHSPSSSCPTPSPSVPQPPTAPQPHFRGTTSLGLLPLRTPHPYCHPVETGPAALRQFKAHPSPSPAVSPATEAESQQRGVQGPPGGGDT